MNNILLFAIFSFGIVMYMQVANGQEDNQTSANSNSSKLNEFIDCYKRISEAVGLNNTANGYNFDATMKIYNLCETLLK